MIKKILWSTGSIIECDTYYKVWGNIYNKVQKILQRFYDKVRQLQQNATDQRSIKETMESSEFKDSCLTENKTVFDGLSTYVIFWKKIFKLQFYISPFYKCWLVKMNSSQITCHGLTHFFGKFCERSKWMIRCMIIQEAFLESWNNYQLSPF